MITAPNKHSLVLEVQRAFNGGARITEGADKHRFCDAVVARLKGTGEEDAWRWGRKSRHSHTGPLSEDTLGYWLGSAPAPNGPTDGQLDAIDIITSSGDVVWFADPPHLYRNIFAMWYPVDAPADTGGGDSGGDDDADPGDVFLEKLLELFTVDVQRLVTGVEAILDTERQLLERFNQIDRRLEDAQKNGVRIKLR